MKAITLGLAAFLFAGLTAAYGADKKDDNKTKIVAVWEVVKGDVSVPKGASTEFTKDGKIKINTEADGKKITMDGSYQMDGDSIKITLKGPDGKDYKQTLKIKKLTDKELTTEDEKGRTDEYKKKDDKDK